MIQACEVPSSQNEHSHYVCDDNGEVRCLPGWTGDLCDVPKCRKGCDPIQGYCQRPGECRCKLGYYGDKCNKCIALPGCQHGYCNTSFECICHEGWDGLFCSERKYFFTDFMRTQKEMNISKITNKIIKNCFNQAFFYSFVFILLGNYVLFHS